MSLNLDRKEVMKKSLKVSTLALACAMSASLIMGGCGDKNKTKASKSTAQIEKIKIRKVDNAEAEKALSALGFDKSDTGLLNWANREGSQGSYTFKNVTLKDNDEASLNIAEVKLLGVHMQDEQPVFDKVELENLIIHEKNDDAEVKLGKMVVVKPSPALSGALGKLFQGVDDPFENIEGDISFQAVRFSDLNLKSDEGVFTVKSAAMGEETDKTGMLSINGLDFAIKEGTDNIGFKLDSIDITGVDIEKHKNVLAILKNGGNSKASEKAMMNLMNSSNMFEPGFKHMSVKGFDGNFDGLLVTLDSYAANADKKGSKTIMTTKMSPLKIVPSDTIKDRELQEMAKAIKELGYDSLEFTMGGESILDEASDRMKSDNTWFELKDGFRLNYSFDFVGYKEMAEKLKMLSTNGDNANPMESLEAINALKVDSLRVEFKDNSIIDRGFKLAASKKGTDPENLKNQAKASLAFLGMMAKDEAQQKLANELGQAVGSLLESGGSLVIEMNPANPVSIEKFMGSGQPDIAALGLTISHK